MFIRTGAIRNLPIAIMSVNNYIHSQIMNCNSIGRRNTLYIYTYNCNL